MQHFTPIEYLKIDIANNFGLDKKSWNERLDWFKQNENKLETLVNEAENSCEFFAGVNAYKDYKAGKPTGYMVGLDCTCSVLQWLSILTGDEDTAKLCNVVNTGNREDAYTIIYKRLCERIPNLDTMKISRESVKRSVMTSYYCSKKLPKELLGEEVAECLSEVLHEVTPIAIRLKDFLKNAWDPEALSYNWIMPDNFYVKCEVEVPVESQVSFMGEVVTVTHLENLPTDEGRFLAPNLVHSVDALAARELITRCMLSNEKRERLNKIFYSNNHSFNFSTMYRDDNMRLLNILIKNYEKSGFLSTRIFDCIDENSVKLLHLKGMFNKAKELYSSLPTGSFYIEAIHDCFKCHPNYMDIVREQWVNVMYEICDSSMLGYILSQMLPKYIFSSLKDLSKPLAPKVKEAEYALS